MKEISTSCFDFLLLELLRTSSAASVAGHSVADEDDGGLAGSRNSNSGVGSGSRGALLGPDTRLGDSKQLLRSLGVQVGARLGERFARDKARFEDTLDAMKYFCKDVWHELHGKQVDKLRVSKDETTYMLLDNECSWYRYMDAAVAQDAAELARVTAFPCGLVEGALAALGVVVLGVEVESSALPACRFTVRLPKPAPGTGRRQRGMVLDVESGNLTRASPGGRT